MNDTTPWFTPISATRTLPLVSRIVRELIELRQERGEVAALIELLPAGSKDSAVAVAQQARRRAASIADRIDSCHAELALIGCRMRDIAKGLVDFPAERDGHEVILSWQLGEGEVGYWFDIDPNDRERRPLDELFSIQESA